MAKQLTKAEIEKELKKLLNLDVDGKISEAVLESDAGGVEDTNALVNNECCSTMHSGTTEVFSCHGDNSSTHVCNIEVPPSQNLLPKQLCEPMKNGPMLSNIDTVYNDHLKNSPIKGNRKNSPTLMTKSENVDQIKFSKSREVRSKKKKKKKKHQQPKVPLSSAVVDPSLDIMSPSNEVLISHVDIPSEENMMLTDTCIKQEFLENVSVHENVKYAMASKNDSASSQLTSDNSPRKLIKQRQKKPLVIMTTVVSDVSEASDNGHISGMPAQNKFDFIMLTSPMKAVKALESYNLSNLDRLTKCQQMEDILVILKEQHILPLKKKSVRHPRANYFCHMCEYHCDNLIACKKHMRGARHVQLKEEEELDFTLRQLPPPEDAQADAIGKLLRSWTEKIGLSSIDIDLRKVVVKELSDSLIDHLPDGCIIELYGSSSSGVGLKGCHLDVDLRVPSDSSLNPALVLKEAYHSIMSSPNIFCNVRTDWGAKLPVIYFEHCQSHLQCVLGLNNIGPCQTTQLIKAYVKLDPRVWILCTMLRYWAQMCEVNKQQEGTLPAHAFDLMVIYFLQQQDPPVLPVLHELVSDNTTENSYLDAHEAAKIWTTRNSLSVGFLWVELFRFYAVAFPNSDLVVCIRDSVPLTTLKRNWRGRKIAIEDPFVTRRNLARSVSSQKNYEFILSCLKHTFKYFGIPQTESGPLFDKITRPPNWSSGGPPEEVLSCSSKKSKLLDESLSSLVDGGGGLEESPVSNTSEKRQFASRERLNSTLTVDSEDLSNSSSGMSSSDEEDVLEVEKQQDDEKASIKQRLIDSDSPKKDLQSVQERIDECRQRKTKMFQLPTPPEILALIKTVKLNDYSYDFYWFCLTGGKKPIIECSICQKEGHLKHNCPDEILPPLQPLPSQHPEFTRFLTELCRQIVECFTPRLNDLKMHESILNELTLFIQDTYPDAQLELFGSSCNGFGFRNSDLDICVTFKSNKNGQELNFAEIITNLGEKLKKCKSIYQVVSIPTAKVPIVKFTHRRSGLECDVSLYNTLAQHNTRMLHLYSRIDPRVRPLGYTMKYFAKLCDIGDASRGSLSSYAYTLMVLYFLQQRRPPVIPVLQELYDHSRKTPPKNIVEGWNAWYFSDFKKLDRVWHYYGRNKESIGELWTGLLRFYTEEFNFKEHVVSIRQLEPITRFEKLWNSRCIAIEDPFDLSHNLGLGVSRKMNIYIMKAFIRGREVFGTPLSRPPHGYACFANYLFDPKVLTDGPPPNDRCCRACGRIGHLVRDCPRKKQQLLGENDKKRQNKRGTVKDRMSMKEVKTEDSNNSASPSRTQNLAARRLPAAPVQNRTVPAVGHSTTFTTVESSLPSSPRKVVNRAPVKQQFGYPVGVMPLRSTNKLNKSNPASEQSQDLSKIVDPHINGLLSIAQPLSPVFMNHPSKSQVNPTPVSSVLTSNTPLPLFARAPHYTAFTSEESQKLSSNSGMSNSSCSHLSPRGFQNPLQATVACTVRPVIQMPNSAMIRCPWPTASLPRPFSFPQSSSASKPGLAQSDAQKNHPSLSVASAVMKKTAEQPSSPGKSIGAVSVPSPMVPVVTMPTIAHSFHEVDAGQPVCRVGLQEQKRDRSVLIHGWSAGRGRNEAPSDQIETRMQHLPR